MPPTGPPHESPQEESATPEEKKPAKPRDRRKRHRAKMSVRVLVRGGIGSLEPFEDVGVTIDASRDGLLIETSRGGYWENQVVEVTFPYDGEPHPVNPPQRARVVRTSLMQDRLHYSVGLQFQKTTASDADGTEVTSYFPLQVRVLVVEPDQPTASGIRETLEADGYQVLSVPSSKHALDILRNESPDVVLAVAESGDISGQDLCAIMKKNVRLQHIPVILMTRSAQTSDYVSCHQVGAVMCIALPCPPNKLRHAVRLVAPPPSMRSAYNGKVNVSSFVRTS